MMLDLNPGQLHASCVDFNGFGILILGASGAGKSSLALACISLGAVLVCDDLIILEQNGVLCAPNTAINAIEVRNVGLVPCHRISQTNLDLVVQLDRAETERLPEKHFTVFKETRVPLIFGKDIPNLHYVLHQLAKNRQAEEKLN